MEAELLNSIADWLSERVQTLAARPVAEPERKLVRQHLLDGVAAGLIGCANPLAPDLRRACQKGADGAPSLADAAMLWAFCINASVLEDGSKEGACHPAAAVLPVLCALGGARDWETIDRAVIAGYDVMIRIARAGNPYFTRKGFHPTAIAAPFGAAATFAALQGFGHEQTRNALCLAAQGGAGLMAAFKCGPSQPLQVAWSVRNGVQAAQLAALGHAGYARIFEEGFFPAYLSGELATPVDAPLAHELAVQGSYLKPYPGCRHLHSAIDALTAIIEREGLRAEEVDAIRAGTYQTAIDTEIHHLNSRGDAYFNLAYAMAARLVLGHCGYDAFAEEHFDNPRIRALMEKTTVAVDAELNGLYPKKRAARVEVLTRDGRVLAEEVLIARGEPENPLPDDFTRGKFRDAAQNKLTAQDQERVAGMLAAGAAEATDVFSLLNHFFITMQGARNAA
jgi:2-methylcitrate dehydratase PrpD